MVPPGTRIATKASADPLSDASTAIVTTDSTSPSSERMVRTSVTRPRTMVEASETTSLNSAERKVDAKSVPAVRTSPTMTVASRRVRRIGPVYALRLAFVRLFDRFLDGTLDDRLHGGLDPLVMQHVFSGLGHGPPHRPLHAAGEGIE